MHMKLTKSAVDRLRPQATRYDVIDSLIPGFVLRVNTDGSKTAMLRYRRDGRNRAFKLGIIGDGFTMHEARRNASKARGIVDAGGDPARDREARRASLTFAEVAERFMTEAAEPYLKATTVRNYWGMLRKHVLPALGRMKVAEVERADIEGLHQRVGKSAPGTANRVLALVSVVMTNAERWGHRPAQSNPCHRMPKFRERKMERFLSSEERAQLDAVLSEAHRASKGQPLYVAPGSILVIRLLSLTGARSSEITGLQWSMVDLERGCLRLPDSKTGAKVIPLTPTAVAMLRELAAQAKPGVPWVCTSERDGQVNNLRRAWLALRSRAGLDDVRLHDLRHSAASDALASGVPLALVGAMLGHKHPQTTQRYAHLNDATLQEAARMMGEAIEKSTQEGTERLRQRQLRAVGDDQGEHEAEVAPIDGKVLRFPDPRR